MESRKNLMAAFGKVIITPEEKAPLQGYDPSEHIADPLKDKLDDLYARIAVFDDGNKRCVLVSVDSCLVNEVPFQATDPSGEGGENRNFPNTFAPGSRKLWAKSADTQMNLISVFATHTHSAPAQYSDKYTLRIAAKISEVVGKLRPVSMSIAAGECSINANRRPNLQPNPTLAIDHSLQLAMFYGEDGVPLGGLVNCAVHPTVLINPANRISGDIVGVAMNKLEVELGNDFVGVFIQGFSGDVCPSDHIRKPEGDTYPLMLQIGQSLYEDLVRTMEKLEQAETTPLIGVEAIVNLPTRKGYYKTHVDVTVLGLRIGDLALLCVSAEVFNGYVGQIKQQIANQMSYHHLMFAGVANGYSGYLPTAEAFEDSMGGYEMNTTIYDRSATKPFLDEAVHVLKGL